MLLLLAGLAYVIWRPVSNGAILYPVLGVVAAVSVWLSVRDRLHPNRGVLAATYLLLIAVTVGLLVGSLSDNAPGLIQQATQWGGAILLWFAFANALTVERARTVLGFTIVTIAVSAALMLVYIASQRGLPVPPLPDALIEQQGAGADYGGALDDGGIRWLGLSTLAIGAPLVTAAAILGPDRILPGRRVTIPAAALCLLAAAFAGRRGILVVAVATPLLVAAIRWALTHRQDRNPLRLRPGFLYAAPFAFLAVVASWDTEAFARARLAFADAAATYLTGSSGIDTLTADDVARVEQTQRLLDGWARSPLVGHGIGAVIPGYARSEDRPWMFELQYHMLLFDIGIVGVLLAGGALLLGWRELRRAAIARPDLTPSLTATAAGAVSLMIANASNPYLQAVGHGWGIALVAGVVTAAVRQPAASHLQRDREPDLGAGGHRSRGGARHDARGCPTTT